MKCVKATVVSFGYPVGALALSTAVVNLSPPSTLTRNDMMLQLERALSLYEVMGNDIRNELRLVVQRYHQITDLTTSL